MSAQLDVLAVMDTAAMWCEGKSAVGSDLNLRQARAAVAALIAERDALRDALVKMLEQFNEGMAGVVHDELQAIATARAALARAQGVQS